MEIVYRDLSTIKPNPKNPRKPKPNAIVELAESIKNNPDYFEARPILLSDRTGELVIVGGERRSEAARYLEMEQVPTILIPNLTEERENELMILDNVHSGVWDEKMLESWDKAKLLKWGIDLPKWDRNNISPDNYGESFNLPSGDKAPFSQITFTLASEQADFIKDALVKIKNMREYKEISTFGNKNTNGNAIYAIVKLWVNAKK